MLRIDYYEAPDCSKLCSSGSGKPKANGTQECSCTASNKVSMTAGRSGITRGYSKSLGIGSISPDTYKGIEITSLASYKVVSSTSITFESAGNMPDTLKIKINGTVYDFNKTGSLTWERKGIIFAPGQTYTIEFLN